MMTRGMPDDVARDAWESPERKLGTSSARREDAALAKAAAKTYEDQAFAAKLLGDAGGEERLLAQARALRDFAALLEDR